MFVIGRSVIKIVFRLGCSLWFISVLGFYVEGKVLKTGVIGTFAARLLGAWSGGGKQPFAYFAFRTDVGKDWIAISPVPFEGSFGGLPGDQGSSIPSSKRADLFDAR